jgi:hypothetical protein
VVGLLVVVGYWRTSDVHRGMTTEAAAVMAFLLGALAQSDMVVELDDVLFLFRKARPGFMVGVIGIWDECVEPVISACELENDEDGIIFAGDRLDGKIAGILMELAEGALHEHRNGPGGGCSKDGGA